MVYIINSCGNYTLKENHLDLCGFISIRYVVAKYSIVHKRLSTPNDRVSQLESSLGELKFKEKSQTEWGYIWKICTDAGEQAHQLNLLTQC